MSLVELIELTAEQLKEAIDSRLKLAKPTPLDQANALKWMNWQGLECYGSLLEADQKIIALDQDEMLDGMMSEDGDKIVNRVKVASSKAGRRKVTLAWKSFNREKFMDSSIMWKSKHCTCPELTIAIDLLLVNDNVPRTNNNGPVMVLWEHVSEPVPPKGPRGPHKENVLIDALANVEIKIKSINILWNNEMKALAEKKEHVPEDNKPHAACSGCLQK